MEGWYHHHSRGGSNDWDLNAVVRYACGGRVSPPPSSSSDDPFSSFLAPLEVKDEEGLPYAAASSLPFNGDAAVLDELSVAFFGAGAASARPGPSQTQQEQIPAATEGQTNLQLHRDDAAPPPLLPQTSGRQASGGGEGSRSKRKKKQVKKVVQRVAADGVSADPWAWRKYGQKPIKGSPYPRGYYRCSTDKACAARKMVERCRNDPDAFILTYTGGDHSHPAPIHRNSLAGTTRNRQQQRAEPPSAGGQSASASATAVAAEPSPGQSTSGGSPTTTSPRSPSMEEECNQEEAEGDEAGGASMMLMPKDEDVEMAGEEDDELKTFLGAYDQPAMDDDVGDSSRHATMDGNHAARVSPLLNVVEETFVVTPWATALGDATGWS